MFNYNPRNIKISAKKFFVSVYTESRFYLDRIFWKISKIRVFVAVGVILLGCSFYFGLISAPDDFPVGAVITVENGAPLTRIAENLENQNVVKSAEMFSALARLLMNEKGVLAGDYFFEEKYSTPRVVWRMIRGIYGITPTRITFVEGLTIYDMAELLSEKFPKFDKIKFIKIAEEQNEEGYLFPDTYYFLPSVTPEAVIKTMRANFDLQIAEIAEKIKAFGKTLEEIVIMASILEKEARTLNSKRVISGILWKRIEIDMPLQVDAVFPYIIGKNTYQLSLDDLKTDSPYNTYKNKGLPVGPIANPSIYSILATVTPVASDYLFYLSDRSGNMYYAADFEQHKQNKRLYVY